MHCIRTPNYIEVLSPPPPTPMRPGLGESGQEGPANFSSERTPPTVGFDSVRCEQRVHVERGLGSKVSEFWTHPTHAPETNWSPGCTMVHVSRDSGSCHGDYSSNNRGVCGEASVCVGVYLCTL